MKFLSALLIGTSLAVAVPAFAQQDAKMQGMGTELGMPGMNMAKAGHEEMPMKNSVKLELIPASALEIGKMTKVAAKLSDLKDGAPLALDDLKEAHTKKLHLLVIDPSLSDYKHIHPVAGTKAGEYVFDFTPLKSGSYRVWADVVPVATGKQEYVQADMGTPVAKKVAINKTPSMVSTVDGYTFTLALDGTPKAGEAVMGNITVTKDGKPFTQLEPVMGAFAHVVGFTEDYSSVMHIHPMGKEPASDAERGGPKLDFHIEPSKTGFVKMFA